METEFLVHIVVAVASAVLTGVVGYAFWLKREDKVVLDDLKTRVAILEQKSLSEPRVREIISEETRELKAEIHGLKSSILSLSELISNLRVDLGVLNYIKDRSPGRDENR